MARCPAPLKGWQRPIGAIVPGAMGSWSVNLPTIITIPERKEVRITPEVLKELPALLHPGMGLAEKVPPRVFVHLVLLPT